jgi:cellobiose epimerase
MRSIHFRTAVCAVLTLGAACNTLNPEQRVFREIKYALTGQFLEVWYPRCVDADFGGFLTGFTYDWNSTGPQVKAVVTQARHVWTTSQAAVYFPGNPVYRRAAEQGFRFLGEKMWDRRFGGFFQQVNRRGNPDDSLEFGFEKRAYGNAFGIFACAAYYRMSGDTAALNLGREAFRWLEAHSHDAIHGDISRIWTGTEPLSVRRTGARPDGTGPRPV